MAESRFVTLAGEAKPVHVRAFGELTVDAIGKVTINGQRIEDIIVGKLELPLGGTAEWSVGTTLASVSIDVVPHTASDIHTTVNGEAYEAAEDSSQQREAKQ